MPLLVGVSGVGARGGEERGVVQLLGKSSIALSQSATTASHCSMRTRARARFVKYAALVGSFMIAWV